MADQRRVLFMQVHRSRRRYCAVGAPCCSSRRVDGRADRIALQAKVTDSTAFGGDSTREEKWAKQRAHEIFPQA